MKDRNRKEKFNIEVSELKQNEQLHNLCNHYFRQKDTMWKSCIHCGKLEPLN